MSEIRNSIFWITGASSGIGEATVYQAAGEGAKLVISARRKEELERVKKATGLPENDVLVLPIDLQNLDEIPAAVDKVISHFGRIDILFNNAGVSQRSGVLDTKMEVFEKLMNINYLSVVALTKAVLPLMLKQQSGHILVTSSIAGKLATPLRAGYSGSKHALHGFFDALRAETYKDNLKVTIVCPGYIRTDISKNAYDADGSKYGKMDNNQENGLSAEVCAKRIIKGIKKNKHEMYIGKKEVLGVYLKRFVPSVLDMIIRKQAPK